MKPPFDSKSTFYRWGPIPGKYFYAAGDSLDSYFHDTVERYGEAWPDSLWLAREGRVIWLTDFAPIWAQGKEYFLKKIVPNAERAVIYGEWEAGVEALTRFEQRIERTDLGGLNDGDLARLIADFYVVLTRYWSPTLYPEAGNYAAEKLIEDALLAQLSDAREVASIMEVITAPEELSFYRLEEIALSQTEDLTAHQRNYFWLLNSHNGVQELPVEYFERRKRTLAKSTEEDARLQLSSILKRKEQTKTRYGISDEIMRHAQLMGASILWQDRRKMNTFISLHYKYALLKEASRRTHIPEEELFQLNLAELGKLVAGGLSRDDLSERQNMVGVWCTRGNIEQLSTADVERFWKLYAEETADIRGHIDMLSGVIASTGSGPVRGKVQILLDPMRPFEEGCVLVTTLTSPEYVFAMRKACAIVTDTGGVGSHAAITSRELGKPCVVGTKIATKIFKDGDMVEVDAEKGIVRKV
jgi:phosphohistidine swiveling domain-containing protein